MLIHYFFFLLNWIEINRLKVCNTNTHTHTMSSWPHHKWNKLSAKVTSFFFPKHNDLYYFYITVKFQYCIWKKKERNWRKNKFKRFWHLMQNPFRKYNMLFLDNTSCIDFIYMLFRWIVGAALNFMPIPTNHTICVHAHYKMRSFWSNIFNQKMRDNNVNGMVLCHLSSIFNLLTSKRWKLYTFFLST